MGLLERATGYKKASKTGKADSGFQPGIRIVLKEKNSLSDDSGSRETKERHEDESGDPRAADRT
jgi:hypothetical protein